MSSNSIPTHGDMQPVRAILKVGSQVLDFTEWEAEHSGIMEAGTFRAAISAPAASWAWWAQQTEILVDVYAGSPRDPLNYSTDDLTLLMTARCDSIELMPDARHIRLAGRDMTSLLIDNKTTEKWPNLTSSEIAAQIAALWGFQSNIQATTTIVGHFYATDHVKLAKADTYWNVLTYLAQREGFQCFVLGRTLYFGNFGAQASSEPYLIEFDAAGGIPKSNALDLRFSRDLTLAQDLSVTVRSYHGQRGAAFSATATASKTAKRIERDAEIAQTLQHYDYTFPGLTQPECALKAQQILGELTRHELKLEARLPFDAILYPWVPVQVTGTATPWDATYVPQSIARRVSKEQVRMRLRARTGIPQQTVTLA